MKRGLVDYMSYFSDGYTSLKLPIAGPDGLGGLRNAQLGAIHAIASHFTVESRPALAVLPTGAGKTAVLMVSAFLLRATRVLVITPSTLVREQIAGKFGELDPLRALDVIPATLGNPRVLEVKKRMATSGDWQAVRNFEVVVSTPNCISTAHDGICIPSPCLFDLLLIDEAHQSPAKTWQALLDQFPDARALLVTATPFRRDKKEIRGRFVYRKMFIETYSSPTFDKARRFYTAQGFNEVGGIRNYLPDGADMVVYLKTLSPTRNHQAPSQLGPD
jgi:type I site-specific restriction endonuclease